MTTITAELNQAFLEGDKEYAERCNTRTVWVVLIHYKNGTWERLRFGWKELAEINAEHEHEERAEFIESIEVFESLVA